MPGFDRFDGSDLWSTAIYDHVERDPSRKAANRVIKGIAEVFAGATDHPSHRNSGKSVRKR